MMKKSQALIFCLVVSGSVGCDHVTKQIAHTALADSSAVSLVADTVRFELASNPGAFLSLGASLPAGARHLILLVLVPAVLVFTCAILLRSGPMCGREIIAIGMFAGGGFANWFDRMLHDGSATDFVSLGVGSIRTGIFNLADLAIIFGLALFVLSSQRVPPSRGQAI